MCRSYWGKLISSWNLMFVFFDHSKPLKSAANNAPFAQGSRHHLGGCFIFFAPLMKTC
jgi:hypothetical protein